MEGRPRGWTARVGPLELSDEGGIQDVLSGDPAPLIRTKNLPIQQALESASLATRIQQFADSVNVLSLNGKGSWDIQGPTGGMGKTTTHGFE